MTTTNGEQVIKRDEYTVGMRVRLVSGASHTITSDHGGLSDDCPLIDDGTKTSWCRDGMWASVETQHDIIGEVVANEPTTQSATTAKRVGRTEIEEWRYDDGMRIVDGRVDSKTMTALLDDRRFADRAIDRLKAWGKHYGREV